MSHCAAFYVLYATKSYWNGLSVSLIKDLYPMQGIAGAATLEAEC